MKAFKRGICKLKIFVNFVILIIIIQIYLITLIPVSLISSAKAYYQRTKSLEQSSPRITGFFF